MSDNGAVMDGYVREVWIHGKPYLVRNDQEFDYVYHLRAWDIDEQTYVILTRSGSEEWGVTEGDPNP